ncbi:BatD family protein [Pseudoalteromonas ulvae]|uniref:Protein BatD n=1 Tax=Pseudoalteromonas ulvae TaxID=107327 RepID=A0A244CSD3_PSEDV|nr:BatD family protein [Pseudoalteromonas ulvae]OUL58522.1 protein BatD [Pseudoalteromonas ulvae]
MVMRCILLLIIICSPHVLALTKLDASVNKNPVLQGEYFVLTIQADDNVQGAQPDTSVLLKDFVVGPTSVSSHTSIINGSISKKTTWQVELMSRKSGQFAIPAFEINGVKSQPYTLTVVKQDLDQQSDDIFIKTSMTPNSLYVQQAGVYNVKLYLAKELRDGQLSAPIMDNAQISQLGKQIESTEIINGKRYLVVSRDYLVQPQKSGDFTITAPSFNGRIQENYRAIAASAVAEDTLLTVKSIPANYQGDWLPSEMVSLHEQWQPEDTQVEVGTPLTRTITLTALGITKEQLPEITLPEIAGIRTYPDQAENNHNVRDGRVISQRVESIALLPQKPGTYQLPEVKIPWFNTVVNRIEYATLPSRTLTVVASSTNPSPSAPMSAPEQPSVQNPQFNTQTSEMTPLQWGLIASGYLLWLITLLLWWLQRNKRPQVIKPAVQTDSQLSDKDVLAQLATAVKSNDNRAFYQHTLALAKLRCNNQSASLDDLAALYGNPSLAAQLNQLQASLYGNQQANVDLASILDTLKLAPSAQQLHASALKPLY